MGIEKSYARATISSNLRDDEHHHDHEKLAAIAMSGLADAKKGHWPHSNMLLRVKYAGDASSYPALLAEWKCRVKIKASARGWPTAVSPSKVARLSLEYWMNDVCPICCGRGSLRHEVHANVLADDACPVCAGTAVRPIDLRPSMIADYAGPMACYWFPHIRPVMLIKYIEDMVEDLRNLTIRAGRVAIKKLSDDFHDFG